MQRWKMFSSSLACIIVGLFAFTQSRQFDDQDFCPSEPRSSRWCVDATCNWRNQSNSHASARSMMSHCPNYFTCHSKSQRDEGHITLKPVGRIQIRFMWKKFSETTASNPRSSRTGRKVFGIDNRIRVPSATLAQIFPFSATVMVDRGCSGTLIWKKHVLTAAHCVHDGSSFRKSGNAFKVGLLLATGDFKWVPVKKVFLPQTWTRKTGLGQLGHDYAVLELAQPHGRKHFVPHWNSVKSKQFVQFAGFPADKPRNQMWFSYCHILHHTKNLFYNQCDSVAGMSGSGVYVYHRNSIKGTTSRRLIGVFSSFVKWRSRDGKTRFASNVAAKLTKRKIHRICQWIGAGRRCELLQQSSILRSNHV